MLRVSRIYMTKPNRNIITLNKSVFLPTLFFLVYCGLTFVPEHVIDRKLKAILLLIFFAGSIITSIVMITQKLRFWNTSHYKDLVFLSLPILYILLILYLEM